MSDLYLLPEDDGLPMRKSNVYAKDKLRILERYIGRFIVSMRPQNWQALFYIDLLAGPGKNLFTATSEVDLGSPLIAITYPQPFTHYRFVELQSEYYEALQKRVSASERRDSVEVMQGDCNIVVDQITTEIREQNSLVKRGQKPCLNLAFLDPEGLELYWDTVKNWDS